MDTPTPPPETDSAYIPMNSVHSFRFDSLSKSDNIYESPRRALDGTSGSGGWGGKAGRVWKQARGQLLCLGVPCLVLLVVVVLLLQNNMRKDRQHENYINLTQERETLKIRLFQLDGIKRNLTGEKERLQASITELDQRNKKLTEEKTEIQRTLSDMKIRLHNLTEVNAWNNKKLDKLGWCSFGSSWYWISSDKRNWSESRADCQERGGDLVTINSRGEQLFLAGKALRAWIGLTDMEEEGTWKWVDGTNLTKAYWNPGQPNDYRETPDGEGQNCALIWDRTNPMKTWNDEACSKSARWICEV
ncbi:asialoglycoprotein receptor 1-like [Engraulis encrasicolus]|uniref:asialoglycoprotein receptor 1-like n=1 Tax=Engraulis encrasicolus TaxID=184585 RepID=UPI002FD40F5E